MTPEQQDDVVEECFNCKLCYVNCPYIPSLHEWDLDFPRLMLRAEQVAHKNGKDLRTKLTDAAMAKTDLIGKVAVATGPLTNAIVTKTGTGPRKALEKVTGLSAERVLAPYVKQRFSRWFAARERAGTTERPAGRETQARAAVFSTCLVEYSDAGVGHDLVKTYEKNCIECTLPEGQVCCGAPYLHQGDVDNFVKLGRKNVAVLAAAIRAGNDVVVPQPTCGYILKQDYVDYIGGSDARLVAENTYDAAEYLMKVHKAEDTELDTNFEGNVPETTTYHAPCHLRAQNIGLKSRDLLKLTGTKVDVVAECSGIDGTWGLRAENITSARKVAKKMAQAIEKADSDAVAGDCSLANGGIVLETGRTPLHPLQQLARAYGIGAEEDLT